MRLKYLLLCVLMVYLTSCNTAVIVDKYQVIDGCQYIVIRNSHGNTLTHKGNCNNPIHNCK